MPLCTLGSIDDIAARRERVISLCARGALHAAARGRSTGALYGSEAARLFPSKAARAAPIMLRQNVSTLSLITAITFLCLCSAYGVVAQPPSTLAQLLADFDRELIDFEPQLEIARRIVDLDDHGVLPALEKWLDHEDRHFRANVAFIFAALGDPRGLQVLYGIVDDRSDRPLGQGISAMRILRNADPEGWWIPEQVRADRYYAVHLLGTLRDPRAIEALLPLVDDDELGTKVRWALVEIPHVWDAHLRVVNTGGEDIEDLTVGFPAGRIEFGDVPAGSTTAYREAPDGVYGYAAFRFKIDGQLVTQPVVDWVGEVPMAGKGFTYTLELVPSSHPFMHRMVQLVEVTVDE